jgi:Reverse transcriptase (RNA-dependent DNA polymerase)
MFYNNSEGHKLIIVLYVDDGLVVYQNETDYEMLIADLKAEFQITVSSASSFLGIQINQAQDGSISVTQENYTKRMLEKFSMLDCNKVDTPMEKLSADGEVNGDGPASVPYREAVGSLMYLATGTRPDIMFSVSHVSQALDKPTQNDWHKVKRIFRYLKGTSDIGIAYSSAHQRVLTAYSDADFAGDAKTRRSTSGVVCVYMGGPISWMSRRQKSVALSTTEAEFVAASEASKEVVWLMRLFNEITELVSVPKLLIDNMSTVKLVKNPIFHKRSKHIEVRHFFVREKVEEGQLIVEHVPSGSQLADILTKPLCRDLFVKLRGLLGIIKL